MTTTLAIRIDMPPEGELETSGHGSQPTQAQMDEENRARQKFIDIVAPVLAERPGRPSRTGVVSRIELLGLDVWSELNHYLVLVTVAAGAVGITGALEAVLPPGAQVSAGGEFRSLWEWPDPA